MKHGLTLIALSCYVLGWAFAFQPASPQSCGRACGHSAPKESPCEGRQAPSDPCAACCVCCASCCVADVAAADGLWVLVASGARVADPAWRALGRDYPPPFPPPRLPGSAIQAT